MSAWPRRPRSVPCPGEEECGGSMVAYSGGWGSGSVGPGPCPFTQSPSGFMEKKDLYFIIDGKAAASTISFHTHQPPPGHDPVRVSYLSLGPHVLSFSRELPSSNHPPSPMSSCTVCVLCIHMDRP